MMKLLRFLQDCEQFVGSDMKSYPPRGNIKKEDIITIPDENATIFIGVGAAIEVTDYSPTISNLAPDVIESMKTPLPVVSDVEFAEFEATRKEKIEADSREQEWDEKLRRIANEVITWEEPEPDEKGKEKKKKVPRAKIDFPILSERLTDLYHVVGFNSEPYIFLDNRYQLGRGDLQKTCLQILEFGGIKGKSKEIVNEAVFRVTFANNHREYPFDMEKDCLPVENGVVRINYKTGKISLADHSPDHLFTFKIPVIYDSSANDELISSIFRAWTSEEEAPLLFQVPAMALLQVQGMEFKKAILIIGPRNTGKTSYAVKLLTAFFGQDLISRVSLQSLIEDRFSLADLEGKILNVFDDLTAASIKEVGIFKAITGSQHHDILKKGQQRYKGRLFAVHVYTANLIPYLKDYLLNDDAFFERWEIILFPTAFEHNTEFHEQIVSPQILSAFLNGVLNKMVDIRRNNIVRLSTADDVKDIWLEGSDPFKLQDFIRVNFEKDERILDLQEEINKDDVTRAYESYTSTTRLKPLTKDELCKKLLHRGFYGKRPRHGDQRQHVMIGYRWKIDAPNRPNRVEGDIRGMV